MNSTAMEWHVEMEKLSEESRANLETSNNVHIPELFMMTNLMEFVSK